MYKKFRFKKKNIPKLIRMNELGLQVVKKIGDLKRTQLRSLLNIEEINTSYSLIYLPERNNEAFVKKDWIGDEETIGAIKKWVSVLWTTAYSKTLGQQLCGKLNMQLR